MARRVWVAGPARRDLENIIAYYRQPGAGVAAERKLVAIAEAIDDLARLPVAWPKSRRPGTRERVVAQHVIVYVVENDVGDTELAGDVTVARVFGPGQNRDEG